MIIVGWCHPMHRANICNGYSAWFLNGTTWKIKQFGRCHFVAVRDWPSCDESEINQCQPSLSVLCTSSCEGTNVSNHSWDVMLEPWEWNSDVLMCQSVICCHQHGRCTVTMEVTGLSKTSVYFCQSVVSHPRRWQSSWSLPLDNSFCQLYWNCHMF